MPQVICSPATRKLINVEAIEIACRLLGVEEPVTIRPTRGRNVIGCHRYTIGRKGHRITWSRAYSLGRQSETLWHELTHAAQVESLGPEEFYAQKRFEQRSVGYKRNKFEKQANDCKDWSEFLPLV